MVKNSAKKLDSAQRKRWQKKLLESAANKNPGEPGLRVLLDTNIWFSAVVYGGIPEQVVSWSLKNSHIIISPILLGEILQKLKLKALAPHKWRRFFSMYLEKVCLIVELDNLPDVVRDVGDNHVIAAAERGNVDIIVTGDNDLLELGSYKRTTIINSKEFLKIYSSD